MKIGKLEGTPQEITDAFENHDLRLEDYLERPEAPLSKVWVIVPALSVSVVLALLVLFAPMGKTTLLLLFLLGAGCVLWLTVAIQVRFKNGWATAAVAIGGLLMLLVAGGFIEPKDTPQVLKELNK